MEWAPEWRSRKQKIWIVLPTYNESAALGALLENIDIAMFEENLTYQILLVDDGSRDTTEAIARRYSQHIPIHIEKHAVNLGLGTTIRDGLVLAVKTAGPNDVIIVMDADNTHAPGLIRNMLRVIREGSDVVIASRYQPGSYTKGVPAHRRFLSLMASWLFRIFQPINGVKDYTCGFRAYRATTLNNAFQKYGSQFVEQEGFECMVDILLKLSRMELIIREVPMILRYDFKQGASKMNVPKTILRSLALLGRAVRSK